MSSEQEDFSPVAALFREMANRIERNPPEEFGGAILIVPPESADGYNGRVLEILLVDPHRDLNNFWSTVKIQATIAADEVEARLNTPPPGGYR